MDLEILQWINDNWHGNSFFNELFKYITYLGEFGACWIALGILLLCFKKTRKAGFLVLIALAVDFLIVNVVLKQAVNRTRPYVIDTTLADFVSSIHLRLPTDSSFPSGHSGAAFAACTVLFLYDKKKCWPFLILAALVSFSRIYLCVHFPTDVLAGALIGFAIGLCVWLVYRAIERKRKHV